MTCETRLIIEFGDIVGVEFEWLAHHTRAVSV